MPAQLAPRAVGVPVYASGAELCHWHVNSGKIAGIVLPHIQTPMGRVSLGTAHS